MSKPIIEIVNLSKKYKIGTRQTYYELGESFVNLIKNPLSILPKRIKPKSDGQNTEIWALHNISFKVSQGDRIGIIGRNGAGKSTLLKILGRITAPTKGKIHIRGRIASLLEVGTGFHPSLTGRENIFLNGSILRMSRSEIQRQFDEIVYFAEIEKFLDTPVKHYSSGMYMRLAFAVAAHLRAEILLIDEVLAVGDVTFQKKCLGKMEDISQSGRTILFVSHNTQFISRLCDRAILLHEGRLIKDESSDKVVSYYLQSELGTRAFREWNQKHRAPGNEVSRMKSVKILDKNNNMTDSIDITEPVKVELIYEVLKEAWSLVPAIQLFNYKGIVVFTSNDTDIYWNKRIRKIGIYKSIVTIPGNSMNEGGYFVRIGMGTYIPWRKHFTERDVVGFTIIDSGKKKSARGGYVGQIDGVVRPLLHWETE